MNDKIFVGSGKTAKYSTKISICLSDIPKEHITESKGKKYINLELKERREPDQYGKTHYVTVDTWKPEQKSSTHTQTVSKQSDFFEEDTLPF